jgi:hypothetical protein
VTYEGLHGRWRTTNSSERGAARTTWKARNKTGDGALHLGVVLRVKQTMTGRHGGANRRRRSRRRWRSGRWLGPVNEGEEVVLEQERARVSDVNGEERGRERVRAHSPAMRSLHGRQWPDGRGLHGGGVCARGEDAGRARAKERGARGLKHNSYSTREGEGAATGPVGHQWPWRPAGELQSRRRPLLR